MAFALEFYEMLEVETFSSSDRSGTRQPRFLSRSPVLTTIDGKSGGYRLLSPSVSLFR